MCTFELETLTDYDNPSLIAELHRVAAIIPHGKLRRSEFDRLSKVHSSTLHHRFGTWRKTLIAAGLGERFDDSTEAWSRDEVIHHLQTIAKKRDRNFVTKRELVDIAGVSDKPIRRLFGSYRAALEAAGLSQSPGGVRYSDEECFENLLAVWTVLGRQPHRSDMKSIPSKVGPKAYVLRWGSWRAALKAFVERVNQDAPTGADPTESRKPDSRVSVLPKRGPRNSPLGLRYTVLKRDRFRCVLDGKSPATHPTVVLHVDHIIPWAKGGETVLENLRTLCSECNLGKGARIEDI